MSDTYDDFDDVLGQYKDVGPAEKAGGSKYPKLEDLPDGDYDFAALGGRIKRLPTTNGQPGSVVAEIDVYCEPLQKQAKKDYYLNSPDNYARFLSDLFVLGFPTATWKGQPDVSAKIKDALSKLAGRRFKGTKRSKQGNARVYHNLYMNAGLSPVDANTLPKSVYEQTAKPVTAAPTDECPF